MESRWPARKLPTKPAKMCPKPNRTDLRRSGWKVAVLRSAHPGRGCRQLNPDAGRPVLATANPSRLEFPKRLKYPRNSSGAASPTLGLWPRAPVYRWERQNGSISRGPELAPSGQLNWVPKAPERHARIASPHPGRSVLAQQTGSSMLAVACWPMSATRRVCHWFNAGACLHRAWEPTSAPQVAGLRTQADPCGSVVAAAKACKTCLISGGSYMPRSPW